MLLNKYKLHCNFISAGVTEKNLPVSVKSVIR